MIMECLARTVMGRIRGKEIEYPEEVIEYLTSHKFRELNQETYVERSKMIAVPMEGDDRLVSFEEIAQYVKENMDKKLSERRQKTYDLFQSSKKDSDRKKNKRKLSPSKSSER
ncbi:MAG: hypothetical protein J5920_03780 [Candidatus Methanomethylophilaceae archaeon]|nr:hypothetical protein [Candidatus Methanomethylophilaceae archaeon]